jgi:hypothetical protein
VLHKSSKHFLHLVTEILVSKHLSSKLLQTSQPRCLQPNTSCWAWGIPYWIFLQRLIRPFWTSTGCVGARTRAATLSCQHPAPHSTRRMLLQLENGNQILAEDKHLPLYEVSGCSGAALCGRECGRDMYVFDLQHAFCCSAQGATS